MVFSKRSWLRVAVAVWLLAATRAEADDQPRLLNDRYQLELVATQPDIVTPIGMTFDRQGRLLVVESHTHRRPADYDGPPTDRVRMFVPGAGSSVSSGRWSTFADGFHMAMNVLAGTSGDVYLITRSRVLRLRDADHDGVADQRQTILRLQTETEYPHNGVGGLAQTPGGMLLVGLGENFGAPYRLVGTDDKELAGTGGTTAVAQLTPDGRNIERLATGFWNPFGICVTPGGRIFAVDNDPDSRPPCRLLHIVPGADFGYMFQYGRAGVHPLQAWDGELPGTLRMVCGVGEAPTAIVAHRGRLWVTSWGDHRIERYRLVPRGASFSAERQIVVQGNADFRPTGMAVAPDGSLWFADWVRRQYEVHGTGRIWRLVLPQHDDAAFPPPNDAERLATDLPDREIDRVLASDDPYLRVAGVQRLARRDDLESLALQSDPDPRVRLGWLAALHGQRSTDTEPILRRALGDESADVRLYALRWICDERITSLRDEVAKLVNGPQPSEEYYLAVLAATDWLDGNFEQRHSGITDGLLVRELRNERRSPAAHALALRLLSPDHEFLTLDRVRDYLQSNDEPLRLEAIRSLAQKTSEDRFELLAEVAGDDTQSDAVRAEAIAGLAAAADRYRDLLTSLAEGEHATLAREAARTLRLTGQRPMPIDHKPAVDDLAAWEELLRQPGDADAGRRLFFSSVGGRCCACHRHGGRGGTIGPDLTYIHRRSSRAGIIASILLPSQEIAPQYQPWLLVTDDGKTRVGLRLPKPGDDGIEVYADPDGRVFELPSRAIERRQTSTASIMPDNLAQTVSLDDLRDLVTFLTTSEPDD